MAAINSIASMKTGPAKEALYLDSIVQSLGKKYAEIAAMAGISVAELYQWRTGRRPVPWAHAEKLAKAIGADPSKLSAEYANMQVNHGSALPLPADKNEDKRRADLAMNRVENDVDALRYALGGLVAVMVQHRPAEAQAVSSTIRKSVPKKFVERGFLHELLKVLDKAGKA